jgi:hypothetical protein
MKKNKNKKTKKKTNMQTNKQTINTRAIKAYSGDTAISGKPASQLTRSLDQ